MSDTEGKEISEKESSKGDEKDRVMLKVLKTMFLHNL